MSNNKILMYLYVFTQQRYSTHTCKALDVDVHNNFLCNSPKAEWLNCPLTSEQISHRKFTLLNFFELLTSPTAWMNHLREMSHKMNSYFHFYGIWKKTQQNTLWWQKANQCLPRDGVSVLRRERFMNSNLFREGATVLPIWCTDTSMYFHVQYIDMKNHEIT